MFDDPGRGTLAWTPRQYSAPWLLACLLFWPVHPKVLKPDRCWIRMLLSEWQLTLRGRIDITGAVGTGGIENGRIISIPDGE
jgi:hypothetical protein